MYSPSRWERRLVGSTIATIPYVNRRTGRQPGVAAHALPIIAELIGDAEPDVQKALSWALRSMSFVDEDGDDRVPAPRGGRRRATPTTATARGWSATPCEKLPTAAAEELRATVDGHPPPARRTLDVPRRRGRRGFTGLGVAVPPADRPVVDRD